MALSRRTSSTFTTGSPSCWPPYHGYSKRTLLAVRCGLPLNTADGQRVSCILSLLVGHLGGSFYGPIKGGILSFVIIQALKGREIEREHGRKQAETFWSEKASFVLLGERRRYCWQRDGGAVSVREPPIIALCEGVWLCNFLHLVKSAIVIACRCRKSIMQPFFVLIALMSVDY